MKPGLYWGSSHVIDARVVSYRTTISEDSVWYHAKGGKCIEVDKDERIGSYEEGFARRHGDADLKFVFLDLL